MTLTCPLCKSEDITDDSEYRESRTLLGRMKIKTSDNHFCNVCGVVFKDVR